MVHVFLFIGFIYISLRLIAIYKAYQEDYSNVFVRMYRGWTVSNLLQDNVIKDERVKKVIIISNMIDIVSIVFIFVSFQFFLSGAIIFSIVILINSLLSDRHLKRIITDSTENKK